MTNIRSEWRWELGRASVSGLVVSSFTLKRLRKTALAAGRGLGSGGRDQLPTREIRNLAYIILPLWG